MAPWWWFLCKPKHVGAVLLILKYFNNSTFFNVVCGSWKLKCWILLMHGVTMKFADDCFCRRCSPWILVVLLLKSYLSSIQWLSKRGRERERERERKKGPRFTSRCKWSPCSSNYSGSWSEQTHWERDSAASATGTVSKSLLIALMNIGLVPKQEELISAV